MGNRWWVSGVWLIAACSGASGAMLDPVGPVDSLDGGVIDSSIDSSIAIDFMDAEVPHDGGNIVEPPHRPIEGVDPGPPRFPSDIGILTVSVRTGDGTNDGTDDNSLSLCLGGELESDSDSCHRLDIPSHDDFERGAIDVFHTEGLALSRSGISHIQLRSNSGGDAWVPSCIEVQFDGEPIFCGNPDSVFGDAAGSGEVEFWSSPVGLDCTTCYDDELTHGPMIGAMESTMARIWVRTDATRSVSLVVGSQSDLSDGVITDYAYPRAEDDYAIVLEANGLLPDTEYFYAVSIDGVLKMESIAFHTSPEDDAPTELSFAFGSCAKDEDQSIFESIQNADPDLFVFIGDNHYANSSNVDELRWYYRWSLERPERGAFVAQTPSIATWDDHDYTGNNSDGTSSGKDDALRVFNEYWANPSAGTETTNGVFFTYRYGDIEFFLVDDRYHRGEENNLLGPEQASWLVDALEASDATFKLLACGSQWTAQGSSDSWASFLPARDQVFDAIVERNVEGVVLLSGDIHRSEIRVIDRADAGGYDLTELTSSPLATWNSPCKPAGVDDLATCHDSGNYFLQVDIDTTADDPELIATVRDQDGDILNTHTILRSSLALRD